MDQTANSQAPSLEEVVAAQNVQIEELKKKIENKKMPETIRVQPVYWWQTSWGPYVAIVAIVVMIAMVLSFFAF